MKKIEKELIKKISVIDDILEQLTSADFDEFEVYLKKGDEEVYSFRLIEDSKNEAYKGLVKQLNNRADTLLRRLKRG